MKKNRLYNAEEIKTPEYAKFAEEFAKARVGNPGDGMRTWESWAAFEGVDWSQIKSVVDFGSYNSTTPFFLRTKVGRVLAVDTYEWLEVRKLEDYWVTREEWAEKLAKKGIEEMRGDARTFVTPENFGKVDLVSCISTIEHIPDYLVALRNLLRIAPRVILTTDAKFPGVPYTNYGWFFSGEQLAGIAAEMGVQIDLAEGDDFCGRKLAVIRKIS